MTTTLLERTEPAYWNKAGDPRTRFPKVTDVLPQERYVEWETQGLCLCGCGERTKPRRHRSDEISYFCLGHYDRMLAKLGRPNSHPAGPRQRRATVKSNRARTMDGIAVIELVREHIEANHDGVVAYFCREHGFPVEALRANIYKGTRRMSKKRAKALLLAIGETPHPSL